MRETVAGYLARGGQITFCPPQGFLPPPLKALVYTVRGIFDLRAAW